MLRSLHKISVSIIQSQPLLQKLLLFSLWMPLAAFGSTIYSFSEPIANQATIGFTYTTPDYLTESSYYIPAEMLTSCNISAMQGWVCTGASLNQTNEFSGTDIQVTLFLRYMPGPPGDAFNTDEVNESFYPARLNQAGVYQSFLNPDATLTILQSSGNTAVPEPGTYGIWAGAGLMLIVLRKRQSRTLGQLTLPRPDDSPEIRC